MLYPSLHIAMAFMYSLFRSRSCDCGCNQNCEPNCGTPNNGVRFCKDCSDTESSCPSECITEPGKSPDSSPKSGICSPIKNGSKPQTVTSSNSGSGYPGKNGTEAGDSPCTPPTTTIQCRGHKNKRNKIIAGVVTVSITAGVSIPLITRAFFVPPMPNFGLPVVTVNSFDISTPNVIRANFQVAISSRNSNNLIRFYFDRLRVYVTYRNQQITYSTPLPSNDEVHNQTDAWTANVCGSPVTLEPNNAVALCQEQATGSVRVTIRIIGRVRWKFWFFPSVKHRFSVSCSASIPIVSQQTHIMVRKCSVRL